MLIDLLSSDNEVKFNIELAKLLGLHPAIYLESLININQKASRKNKLDEEGYFKLDRKYISERTTFNLKEQDTLDNVLLDFGILKKKQVESSDYMLLNLEVLTSLLLNPDEKLVGDISEAIKSKNTLTKRECVGNNLKKYITNTINNPELREAYLNWFENVYTVARKKINKDTINDTITKINTYNINRDLDIAIEILRIASVHSWRDVKWAIEEFDKSQSQKLTKVVKSNDVKLSNQAF